MAPGCNEFQCVLTRLKHPVQPGVVGGQDADARRDGMQVEPAHLLDFQRLLQSQHFNITKAGISKRRPGLRRLAYARQRHHQATPNPSARGLNLLGSHGKEGSLHGYGNRGTSRARDNGAEVELRSHCRLDRTILYPTVWYTCPAHSSRAQESMAPRSSPEMPLTLAAGAFRLFAKKGIRNVNLDTVAAAAGVTKGSLYCRESQLHDRDPHPLGA